ncbi:hypothetical protein SLE2022_304210 [Rubroshorea leprosula]
MHSHVYLNYGWLDSRLSRNDSSSGGVHGLDAVVDGSHHLRFCGVKRCAPSIRFTGFDLRRESRHRGGSREEKRRL